MSDYGYVDVGKLADYANNSTVGLTANDIMRFPRADVQPVDRWISVINELPKTTKSCLVWYEYDSLWGRFRDYGISWYTGESWYKGFLEGDNIEVLYWQPLPEPPETTKGQIR